MSPTPRRLLGAAALVLALAGVAVGCGSSDGGSGTDPKEQQQAVEQLRDFGLTKDQATCVVEALGADAVVEAADLVALTDSAAYQDAAKDCTDGN